MDAAMFHGIRKDSVYKRSYQELYEREARNAKSLIISNHFFRVPELLNTMDSYTQLTTIKIPIICDAQTVQELVQVIDEFGRIDKVWVHPATTEAWLALENREYAVRVLEVSYNHKIKKRYDL